jgi:hypothetical protein
MYAGVKVVKSKIKDYWRRSRWWLEKHGLTWHDIKQGVKNLIYWFPAVWLDRWWDHFFLYRILIRKLSQMEKGFREHGHSTNSEKDAKNIKICILLLDRLVKDGYIDYNEEGLQESNIRISHNKEEQMINQDLDLLFKILRKQIRCWWD